jgi:multimeric flavodoxin WrbA
VHRGRENPPIIWPHGLFKDRRKNVKILGLSCSPKSQGNTEILLGEALDGAQQEGAEVELYSVSGKDIKPCDGCHECREKGECHIKDDMQDLYKKVTAANGVIFGTPVYFCSMAAQTKIIIDRLGALQYPQTKLANKVGGIIAVGGSLGLIDVVKDLYFYIVTRPMLPANFVAAYGLSEGDVRRLTKGMKKAGELGRQMVQLAAKKFEYPGQFYPTIFGYGLPHTL